LEQQYGPQINLSQNYLKMMEDPKTDKETMAFLRERLQQAKMVIENYQNRQTTINKMLDIIAQEQKFFVEKGKTWIKPLLQKDLADKLGVHPSTVSRALAGKFAQTPHGLYALKYLCARNLSGHSSHFIKARLLELIEKEDKHSPLSDEQIREIFEKESIIIGRRTVAGFRKHLGIENAKERTRN
jgi:RNA polymerase sigma-54 factor